MTEHTLGIDFGTTNSVFAVLSDGDPEVLENAEGNRLTPSVVYYTKEHEQYRPLVGQSALNKSRDDPERVITSIKREMGNEESITVAGDEYLVEEIAADIIRKLRTDAADKLGVDREELTSAVITTPAYWESDRKQSVIEAARLAGFESVRTIKEPAAAAIAYGRFKPGMKKTVGVYDLGGGTFDFAIVDVDVTGSATGGEYNVRTQSGDPQLGGDDWDQRIVDWIASTFEKDTGINPLEKHYSDESGVEHLVRQERIRTEARSAKEELSNRANTSVNIRIPFLMEAEGETYDVDIELSEMQFESMTEDLLNRTVDPIRTALKDANMSVHDIDEMILVGGSTRMPQVTELVKSVFQQEPKQRVNPDEAVAAGAAIKANRDDILLLEVTPLSLGIGIKGDRFKRMIHRNERLPARTTEVFTTSSEGSTAVRIPIYQGEREIASENRHLKTLVIQGMAPGSRNSAHIEVTFEVQQNGLINVQAVESTTNKSVSVEIEGENRLSDNYIAEKVEEARQLEEMDRRRQKVIEGQNKAEKAITDAKRLLDEFAHSFEEEEVETVRKHITNVSQIRTNDTATLGELREATENLNRWVLKLGDRVRATGARPRVDPEAPPDVEPADLSSDETVNDTGSVTAGGPGRVAVDGEDIGKRDPAMNNNTGATDSSVSGAGIDDSPDQFETSTTTHSQGESEPSAGSRDAQSNDGSVMDDPTAYETPASGNDSASVTPGTESESDGQGAVTNGDSVGTGSGEEPFTVENETGSESDAGEDNGTDSGDGAVMDSIDGDDEDYESDSMPVSEDKFAQFADGDDDSSEPVSTDLSEDEDSPSDGGADAYAGPIEDSATDDEPVTGDMASAPTPEDNKSIDDGSDDPLLLDDGSVHGVVDEDDGGEDDSTQFSEDVDVSDGTDDENDVSNTSAGAVEEEEVASEPETGTDSVRGTETVDDESDQGDEIASEHRSAVETVASRNRSPDGGDDGPVFGQGTDELEEDEQESEDTTSSNESPSGTDNEDDEDDGGEQVGIEDFGV